METVEFKSLFSWLPNHLTESPDARYRHRLLKEELIHRQENLTGLQSFVKKAHEDARWYLSRLAENSLDPLSTNSPPNLAPGYPETLHVQTLRGYFGEIFAGLIAEYYQPFGENGWVVPAYLFRFHNLAFEQLERIRQTGPTREEAGIIPGRTGDDCLAFVVDENNNIIRTLRCEAKCSSRHHVDLISDAHAKVSDPFLIPISTYQLIDILRDQGENTQAQQWVRALQKLRFSGISSSYERYDLVTYICGEWPRRERTRISTTTPHTSYTGGRRLEVVEVHLSNVDDLVKEIYGKTG